MYVYMFVSVLLDDSSYYDYSYILRLSSFVSFCIVMLAILYLQAPHHRSHVWLQQPSSETHSCASEALVLRPRTGHRQNI